MSFSTSISRFADYLRRNGFRATVRRIDLAAKRLLFLNRMVLFYCELSALNSPAVDLPGSLTVERKRSEAEISSQDLKNITSFWNTKLAQRNLTERFGLGASLWLIKSKATLAGYGWTLQGRTVEPHYFQLGPDDVHLFDFHVFPRFRGRGLNPALVNHILRSLDRGRAFIEAAEWNRAQLSSLERTPFRRLGLARKITILGRTSVWWTERNHGQPRSLSYSSDGLIENSRRA